MRGKPPLALGAARCTARRPTLTSLLVAGLSIERPYGFSRAALNFAREEGTGSFYTTGSFRGSMVIARKDICNIQTCYKARLLFPPHAAQGLTMTVPV